MPDASRNTTRPPLADLALAAHSAAEAGSTSFITIAFGDTDVAIGHWPVPAHFGHPGDALIGSLAPDRWGIVGLSAPGRRRTCGVPGSAQVHATVLLDRDGNSAAVLDDGLGDVQTISARPAGVVVDSLSRVIGLPTAPAEVSVAYCVESRWLDSIAAVVLERPGTVSSWAEIAGLHPFAADASPPPTVLNARVQAFGHPASWCRVLDCWATGDDVARHGPPGAEMIRSGDWFDAGSFSRWMLRDLPPAEDLLPAVLDGLCEPVRRELLDALVTVGGRPTWA